MIIIRAEPSFALVSGLASMWTLGFGLTLLSSALAQPLEVGTVPSDQYTAAPAPAPYGTEGWRTGRSTFFDGSDSFKEAYLARSAQLRAADAQAVHAPIAIYWTYNTVWCTVHYSFRCMPALLLQVK